MKQLFYSLTKPFRKPQITGYLVKGGRGAKVRISKVSLEQSITILYAIAVRIEAVFKVDRRYVLKKVLDLDTAAKRDMKAVEKEVRRQIYSSKK